jgi:hypothetical protein
MTIRPNLTTRRGFVAASSVALSPLAFLKLAIAQTAEKADFLFVQSAKGLVFDKATNKLTLTGVSPVTVYFTDRPERIAGNMKTTAFIPFWSEGKDSFKSDPPNADISLMDGSKLTQIVAELQDPVLMGDDSPTWSRSCKAICRRRLPTYRCSSTSSVAR